MVGRTTKTYTVEVDVRRMGARKTLTRALGRYPDLKTREARKLATKKVAELLDGRPTNGRPVTLQEAWERYRDNP